MAVTVIDTTKPFSQEVRQLVQALRTARSAANNLDDLAANMAAGQMATVFGVPDTNFTEAQFNTNLDNLVTVLNDTTVDNFIGLLV